MCYIVREYLTTQECVIVILFKEKGCAFINTCYIYQPYHSELYQLYITNLSREEISITLRLTSGEHFILC